MVLTEKAAERLRKRAFVSGATYTRCGHGHVESVWKHAQHKGLLLERDCCGSWSMFTGELRSQVEYYVARHHGGRND